MYKLTTSIINKELESHKLKHQLMQIDQRGSEQVNIVLDFLAGYNKQLDLDKIGQKQSN